MVSSGLEAGVPGTKKTVLIAGVDGYLGWSLAKHLMERGHDVAGIDAYMRRDWVQEVGSQSATPIARMTARLEAIFERFGRSLSFTRGDLTDYSVVEEAVRHSRPDVIVHLAEMPSAPYSMIDVAHATWTQTNNIVGTLNVLHAMRDHAPDAHLLKLGTMGEYGTPDVAIPEGFFEVEYRGRVATLPFPRQAGSWYHQSKVHDSHNVTMACKQWGLRATDVMQGVVFGLGGPDADPRLLTRFDFDQCFGTAINRFCAQAVIEEPITPYGSGSQHRAFIPLADALQCMTLAIDTPPAAGDYRVFNQFQGVHRIGDLAETVARLGSEIGLNTSVTPINNPRIEAEEHFYEPDCVGLKNLGYSPTENIEPLITDLLEGLVPYRRRIEARQKALEPDIWWDGRREPPGAFDQPS